ncbi:hypothetical protein JTE90_004578 [Oedothorax gibbosus]|uniref:5'-3' exonuclease alpha-helical arch N-terminal domain-containing protein n=1 Tax=Oedothorax gibbosus TaxID=931172 RepID=A0AAV6UL81_9ARAC|nr:hypothetical protein JTE90_004578 [Oedothorax gibbosus]
MLPHMAKDKLLSNERNKPRFILLLQKQFEKAQIITKQATEDVDVLIVQTAISLSSEHDSVVVIGEDIDLLVLVTALAPENVYFWKSGRGNKADALYSKKSFNYKDIAENIFFLHAIGGCDTTSAPVGEGKLKFCTILQKNASHNESISIFKEPFAEKEKITQATATFL